MDGDFWLDPEELHNATHEAEVLSIFFPVLRKSLIIDTRFTTEEQPMVRVVPQARSLEERYRSIRRMRPQFPHPDNVTAIPWPRYINSLVESGAVARIRERLEESGFSEPAKALDRAIEELRQLERLELAAAIQGERYHTLWSNQE